MILFEIRNLVKCYKRQHNLFVKDNDTVYAVNNVSLDIYQGETLALVGESGCGKTTFGRCLLHLITPDKGEVIYNGIDLLRLKESELRTIRPKFQMIFQHPERALNPGQTVGSCLTEPLRLFAHLKNTQLWDRAAELLDIVGLNDTIFSSYPHELSGGQQQRVVIARALSTNPLFIIADEPTSSLDAIYKWQIIQLLKQIQQKLGLTVLFISHDIHLVSKIADRIAVMNQGELIEIGDKKEILVSPDHPYTKLILSLADKTNHAINIKETVSNESMTKVNQS